MHLLARLGGLVAAVGVAGAGWHLNQWWIGNGRFSGGLFWAMAALAVTGFLMTRSGGAFARTVFGASAALFALLAFNAGFIDTKEATYGSSMRSDLQNIALAQKAFFSDSGRFARTLPADYFQPSSGMTPNLDLTTDGWTASVTHMVSPRGCAIFQGTTPRAPAVVAGTPACTRLPLDVAGVLRNLAIVAVGVAIGWMASRSARSAQPA